MIFVKIALLLAVLLILFAVYEVIGLFRKKAKTYYPGDDDNLRAFGDAVFNISADCYVFHDYNQPVGNRYQGNSNVDNGLAQIFLRDDPSSSDLTSAVHKEGWVDLKGNIIDVSGEKLGYITDEHGKPSINGSGRWYELWLRKHSLVYSCSIPFSEEDESSKKQGLLQGKVVETGRIWKAKPNVYTVTARAGGFLLLYKNRQPKPASEDSMAEKTTWKDTALPSVVLFTFIYGLFFLTGMGKMTFPALGEQIGFVAAMLLVFFVLWAILRQIKIEALLEGKPFDEFLMLIDRNTGIGGLNNWIILTASAALLVSIFIYGSDFIPLQAAILIGTWVNRKFITREPWKIADVDFEEESQLPSWTEDDGESGEADSDSGEESEESDLPTEETERRTFKWSLDSWNESLTGELTVSFSPERISELRSSNPFQLNPDREFKDKIKDLLNNYTNNKKVHEVLRYIDGEVRKAGLCEMDRMQFILDFVQEPNIKYAYDKDCEEIGCPSDYARYPDETMYDGRGDCDCKAALAAIMFREAGHKTAYLTTKDHAAIAVAFKGRSDSNLIGMADQSLVIKDGYMYFFCETTGDGFKIGDLGSTTKEEVEDIIFLN